MQKTENYSGIGSINVLDRAIQESMGRIVNRLRPGPIDKTGEATEA